MTLSTHIAISLILVATVIVASRFPRLKIPVLILSGIISLRYILWRGIYTLNRQDRIGLTISLVVFLAEMYGFIQYLLFHYQSLRPTNPVPPEIEDSNLPTVDIFIPIFNEPKDILYRTVIGCLSQDYPKERRSIYILDDCMREEIKELAAKLRCNYITRPTNENIKVRNLNHGLTLSSGEFILVLEPGHVPVPLFLKRTIGFFKEPRVGFVQTPLYTMTADPFQQSLLLGQDIPHEQELFFDVIEPALDRHGATIACGTGVIYRRTALNEVSGFKSDAQNFDMYLSALFHSRGWQSIYFNQNLALHTSQEKCETFFLDRGKKICQALRLLLKGLPLWPKLKIGQRIGYFSLLLNDLQVPSRLIFMLTPIAFLLGIPPIIASLKELSGYFISFFISQTISRHILANHHRHPLWSSVYETADISASWIAITQSWQRSNVDLILKKRLSSPIFPLLILAGIQILGFGIGIASYVISVVSWQLILVGSILAFYNLLLLMVALAAAYGRPQKRGNPRISRETTCRLITSDEIWQASIVDASETGLSLKMATPVNLSKELKIEIDRVGDGTLVLRGEVKRNEAFSWGGASVGIRFISMSDRDKQDWICWLYCTPENWGRKDHPLLSHKSVILGLLTASGRAFIREGNLHRSAPRYNASLPCRLIFSDRIIVGTTVDASITGILLKVIEDPGPLPREMALEVQVAGQTLSEIGRPAWSRRKEDHWEIGIHLGAISGRQILNAVLPHARLKMIPTYSLQARVFRLMGIGAAFVLSLAMAILVVAIFVRTGTLQPITFANFQKVYDFFWLFLFFVFVDGVKVFIEIMHRATLRKYGSDLSQVTALIPCHNTGKAIEYTIEGLQRILPGNQIVIVDDASTDNTAEIAIRKGVQVYTLKENVNKPKAIGIGLQWVKTRYTLLLDDDSRIQPMFLPTSLLEEGNTGVAFYVLPCRRTRENFDGQNFISCLQRYEYAKSMEIGKRFQDKTLSVSCISGAVGLFKTDHLRQFQPLHSNIFPGEDLERTLINLYYDGRIAFVNEPVWTICPDNLKDLTRQRLFNWNPGFFRLFGYYLKILVKRSIPGRLRFEMLYNIYVILSDPLKVLSFLVLLINRYWAGLAFIYLFYLALEIYPFLTVEKKLPIFKYYLPALFLYPAYGIYNTFLRFASLFVWLWHRFITKKWKPKREAQIVL